MENDDNATKNNKMNYFYSHFTIFTLSNKIHFIWLLDLFNKTIFDNGEEDGDDDDNDNEDKDKNKNKNEKTENKTISNIFQDVELIYIKHFFKNMRNVKILDFDEQKLVLKVRFDIEEPTKSITFDFSLTHLNKIRIYQSLYNKLGHNNIQVNSTIFFNTKKVIANFVYRYVNPNVEEKEKTTAQYKMFGFFVPNDLKDIDVFERDFFINERNHQFVNNVEIDTEMHKFTCEMFCQKREQILLKSKSHILK